MLKYCHISLMLQKTNGHILCVHKKKVERGMILQKSFMLRVPAVEHQNSEYSYFCFLSRFVVSDDKISEI